MNLSYVAEVKLIIQVPCYNEESCIAQTLRDLHKRFGNPRPRAVDDTRNTAI